MNVLSYLIWVCLVGKFCVRMKMPKFGKSSIWVFDSRNLKKYCHTLNQRAQNCQNNCKILWKTNNS